VMNSLRARQPETKSLHQTCKLAEMNVPEMPGNDLRQP
jgi:hypothetical protein